MRTGCKCLTYYLGKCDAAGGNAQACTCNIGVGRDTQAVDCTKLIPKCWLMKIESLGTKVGRRPKPPNALVDNDGLYNPDCESDGTFKARQCNGTDTCWCVNSAGVRRTDKGDAQSMKCPELVRTFWVVVQMKLNDTFSGSLSDLQAAITNLITSRYNLSKDSVANIELENPYVYIDLKQNSSAKSPGVVDITDVGYYMEKDIKGDNLMQADQRFDLSVNGRSLGVQEPLILYIDEKPHEISMKRLTAGVIAVIVVVVVAIVAGIVVLVLTRRKRGRYEKAEMKEMNEMQKELNS
ncbi:epithelial cell adhesion molecule isoform X2 [Pseudophryne corroboree]|uniref:epithelial cell adhesion molecule isoform X2 n=1 Tax=Pseudophryne corroboree TaxID=495146 RepID=UPI003081E843